LDALKHSPQERAHAEASAEAGAEAHTKEFLDEKKPKV